MIITALAVTDQIRAAVPCSLLSFSMIPFATASLGIGAASWIVPRKTIQSLDNALYSAYMRLCLFVFENVSGVQIKLYGDIERLKRKPETALVLSNHQSDVDWAVIVMLAQRQGAEGSDAGLRIMVKHGIHYVPLFGWYIFQHGYIYVRRFGEFLSTPVLKQLLWLDSLNEKYWLLVFPEGTRFSSRRKDNIRVSQEFCRRKGIPHFKNVLSPRAGSVFMALENLESLDAVYDVTIAYGQTRLPSRRGLAPNMFEFCCGSPIAKTVSVYVKRHPVEQLRKSRKELQEWIIHAYAEKDKCELFLCKDEVRSLYDMLASTRATLRVLERLLDEFHKTGDFPNPVSTKEPAVSIIRTLPPTLLFTAALVAPFYSPAIRNAYLYTVASFPFLILWLEFRKCV